MTPEFAIWICRETLFTALMLAAPMLISGLIIGVAVSLIQAATQVNEMTLSFIPKILGVVLVMLFTLPWMINVIRRFTSQIFAYIAAGMM